MEDGIEFWKDVIITQGRVRAQYNGMKKCYYTPEHITEMDAERDHIHHGTEWHDKDGIHIDMLDVIYNNPGTSLSGFYGTAMQQVEDLIKHGHVIVEYLGTKKRYYPSKPIAEKGVEDAKVYLAAGLHRDGTIHIYLKEKDVGLRIRPSPSEDHMIITTDDDSFGLVRLSDVGRLQDKIGKQADHIDCLLHGRGVLRGALKMAVKRANDTEANATDDADAWKKRECELLEMISDKTILQDKIGEQADRIRELESRVAAMKNTLRKRNGAVSTHRVNNAMVKSIQYLSRRNDDMRDTIRKTIDEKNKMLMALQHAHDRCASLYSRIANMQRASDVDMAERKKREHDLLEMVADRDETVACLETKLKGEMDFEEMDNAYEQFRSQIPE